MFNVLFNPGEATCFASDAKGTKVLPITNFDSSTHAFFSINPLRADGDNHPTEAYHSPTKPRRADHNVIAFRNFLIEMDGIPLEQQIPIIKEKLGDCYTSLVYSGGKSVHCIISLDQDFPTRKEYDEFAWRLHQLFAGQADKATKNPSRLSRTPGHYRVDKGKAQDLIEVKNRVSLARLEAIFTKYNIGSKPTPKAIKPAFDGPLFVKLHRLPLWVQKFLVEGAPEGEWNNTLFGASCKAAEAAIDLEDWLITCESITGYLDSSDYSTINSAFKRVVI